MTTPLLRDLPCEPSGGPNRFRISIFYFVIYFVLLDCIRKKLPPPLLLLIVRLRGAQLTVPLFKSLFLSSSLKRNYVDCRLLRAPGCSTSTGLPMIASFEASGAALRRAGTAQLAAQSERPAFGGEFNQLKNPVVSRTRSTAIRSENNFQRSSFSSFTSLVLSLSLSVSVRPRLPITFR